MRVFLILYLIPYCQSNTIVGLAKKVQFLTRLLRSVGFAPGFQLSKWLGSSLRWANEALNPSVLSLHQK